MSLTDEQIKHMVNRFLVWKLPEDFNPDGGIRFARVIYDDEREIRRAPVGTNLLTAAQAEAMVRNMLQDLPNTEV